LISYSYDCDSYEIGSSGHILGIAIGCYAADQSTIYHTLSKYYRGTARTVPYVSTGSSKKWFLH
jgi:hypothetical protein